MSGQRTPTVAQIEAEWVQLRELQRQCREAIAQRDELLAVLFELKTASDKQDSTFDGAAWLDRVDATIAKVTGEQP